MSLGFIKYLQRMETKYEELVKGGKTYLSTIIQKLNFNEQAFKKEKHW